MSWGFRKYGFYTIVTVLCSFLLILYSELIVLHQEILSSKPLFIYDEKYLVDTAKCKIPNLDPWNYEVKPLYVNKTYRPCSYRKNLSKIVYRNDSAFVERDDSALSEYSYDNVSCCYSNIFRQNGKHPDLGIRLSPCRPFQQYHEPTEIFESAILVRCIDTQLDTEIYANTHSVLPKTTNIKKKLQMYKNKTKPPSILLLGIDSMSRLNFQRVFSKTKNYLDKNNWLEYKGYNKIGDNTFPNLMAILTGKNLSKALNECDPREKLEECNFIWSEFDKLGYVTAYAEDEVTISTFNTYSYKGFRKQPADYYYMPYLMASEELSVKKLDGMTYCSGPETSAERVLNIAKDLMDVFPDHPKFGFLWMNSFSHEDINAPGRLDDVFANFFANLQTQIDNNTFVIFFSDHGIRFGDIRLTRTGWLEERLPFLHFWIPDSFKNDFPGEMRNLERNSIKLTTPYDFYMTLQHILELSSVGYRGKPSEGCANAKSLFTGLSDRSCEEAAILMHWCTCLGYDYTNPQSIIAEDAANVAIKQINHLLDKNKETYNKCARYTLSKVISASISDNNLYNKTFLLLIYETVPKAIFESTVSIVRNYNLEQIFISEGNASRLDRYEATSTCTDEHRIYCYCRSNVLMQLNFFGFWFEI